MGGGVIGVSTAYYLARDGHEVTVIERRPGAAEETSFANAGIVATGHCFSWASPRAPLILLESLFRRDTALRLRLKADPRMWAWCLRFLANCTRARNRANTLRKLGLCIYSQEALAELRRDTNIAYDANPRGALYFYRDGGQLDTAVGNAALLNENGLAVEALDADGCVAIEPALGPARDAIAGAVYCPTDESGDSHAFSRNLAGVCEAMGVRFRFATTITGLRAAGDVIEGVDTDRGAVSGDVYVLALGSYSPLVARGAGIALPVYPVKGYSMTVPTGGRDGAPSIPCVDEHRLVAFCRLGERFRVTATAEFAGYDTHFEPGDFTQMLAVARETFPRAGDYGAPRSWACQRPMPPDGPPVLGRGRHRNLFFNTGHGHLGWTMCCGTGRVTADLISGRAPDIDLAGLTIDRF